MEQPTKIFNDLYIINLGGHGVPQIKKSRENPAIWLDGWMTQNDNVKTMSFHLILLISTRINDTLIVGQELKISCIIHR